MSGPFGVSDPSYKIEPPVGPFHWDDRLLQLERLAEEFWPGKEDDAKALRNWNVWRQFERECPWETFKEFEPSRAPIPTEPEAVAELCTCELQPALGNDAGLGDSLRAELRRQGTSLEELFANQKPTREYIPWSALPPAEYRRPGYESAEIKREIRRNARRRP